MSSPNGLIKLVYLGGFLGTFFFSAVSGALTEGVGGDVGEIGGLIARVMAVPCMLAWALSVPWWIWDAWSSVPEAYREAPLLGRIGSPVAVIALFFVPCFNLVWVFLANLGLTESINRALAAQGSTTRVSTALVICACVLHVVPYCNLLFGPPLWFAVMYVIDQARKDLTTVDAELIARVF